MPKPIVYQDASVSVDVWHGTLRVQCGKYDRTMQPEEFAQLVYPSIKAAADALEARENTPAPDPRTATS